MREGLTVDPAGTDEGRPGPSADMARLGAALAASMADIQKGYEDFARVVVPRIKAWLAAVRRMCVRLGWLREPRCWGPPPLAINGHAYRRRTRRRRRR